MLHHEFEELIGREATQYEYTRANGIYMSIDINKQDFCAEWDEIKDSKVLAQLDDKLDAISHKKAVYKSNMKIVASNLVDALEVGNLDSIEKILPLLIDRAEIIRLRIARGHKLSKADLDYIHENIG